jgi:ketosteroid isomerase-like protein
MQTTRFETPEEAEDAFYLAFGRGDLPSMMAVWAEDGNVVCVHPGGARVEGRAGVARAWRHIFDNSPGLEFTVTDTLRTREGSLAVHVVHEHIRRQHSAQTQPPVIATNIYRLTDKGWRMILHHASPGAAPPPVPQPALH